MATIKLTNDVKLSADSVIHRVVGVDTSNVLKARFQINPTGTTFDYDGWLVIPTTALQVRLDGVKFHVTGGGGTMLVPIHAGQRVTTDNGATNNDCMMYGFLQ